MRISQHRRDMWVPNWLSTSCGPGYIRGSVHRADPSFGDRVHPGHSHRRAQDAHTLAGEHGIEHTGNVLSRSRIKNVN
jgi:hypothetical protein